MPPLAADGRYADNIYAADYCHAGFHVAFATATLILLLPLIRFAAACRLLLFAHIIAAHDISHTYTLLPLILPAIDDWPLIFYDINSWCFSRYYFSSMLHYWCRHYQYFHHFHYQFHDDITPHTLLRHCWYWCFRHWLLISATLMATWWLSLSLHYYLHWYGYWMLAIEGYIISHFNITDTLIISLRLILAIAFISIPYWLAIEYFFAIIATLMPIRWHYGHIFAFTFISWLSFSRQYWLIGHFIIIFSLPLALQYAFVISHTCHWLR